MGPVSAISDQVRGRLQDGLGFLRRSLFGANNERLDLFMDSFNKLSSSQRVGAFVVAGGCLAFLVGLAIWLYVAQVDRLKSDLSNSFAAIHELQALTAAHNTEKQKFDRLTSAVKSKTSSGAIKPFFEKISKSVGVQLDDLKEVKPQQSDSGLPDNFQEFHVEMRLEKISIPRLLNFLVEIEKSGRYMRVHDLQVRSRYGTKLYFDGFVKVRGYRVQ